MRTKEWSAAMTRYSGSCSCGSVMFAFNDDPLWVTACHCDACKKRTGSAYGLSVVMEKNVVKSFVGDVRTFVRKGDSGNAVAYDFCPRCGTTIRWRLAVIPGREVYALGTFDNPGQFKIDGEYYANSALPVARLGCELVCTAAPDFTFRDSLAELGKHRAKR